MAERVIRLASCSTGFPIVMNGVFDRLFSERKVVFCHMYTWIRTDGPRDD
jgi:hypothetical protein